METKADFLRKVAEHVQGGGRVGDEAVSRIREIGYVRLAEHIETIDEKTSKAARDLAAQLFRNAAAVEDIAAVTEDARKAVRK